MTMLGATPNVGQVMAGVIDVSGTLGIGHDRRRHARPVHRRPRRHHRCLRRLRPGRPARVIEAGVERRLEEDPAGQVFSQPNADGTATTPGNPNYINTQYFYESAGFSSPQISARITNGVSDSPDQFDLSTVVFQDGASFNLVRLDASGVSGIRNVAVEGSLVTTLSAAASDFFLLPDGSPDPSPAGVYLPQDDLASVVGPRLCPDGSIVAAEIQGVAFGSFTNAAGASRARVAGDHHRRQQPARRQARQIVQAGSVNGQGTETFRVPFADLPGQQVAFFLDTAPSGGTFDPNNMVFTLESDSDGIDPPTLFPATRGAVTAMIGVTCNAPGLGGADGRPLRRRRVDLLGAVHRAVDHQHRTARRRDRAGTQGLNNVTAPSIFGNIAAAGPLFGTIQTTGVRTDPVTGATSADPGGPGPRLRRPAQRPEHSAVRHDDDDRGPGPGQLYRPDHQPRQPDQLDPQRWRRQRAHRRTGQLRRDDDAPRNADAGRRIAGQRRVQRPARGPGQ